MGWTLTIDHVCKDEPVEGFAYEPPGEWRLTLPLSQLHIVFLKAADEGRFFPRVELTTDGRTFALTSAVISACSTGPDYINVDLVGTPA